MSEINIKLRDIIDDTPLPPVSLDHMPEEGEPIEINGEMFFVCEKNYGMDADILEIGVIPLVIKNPKRVQNINSYINCLSVAHRRVQFRKAGKICDFDECDEMIID